MLECRCSLIASVFLAVSAGLAAAPDMSARICAVGEHTRFVSFLLAARTVNCGDTVLYLHALTAVALSFQPTSCCLPGVFSRR